MCSKRPFDIFNEPFLIPQQCLLIGDRLNLKRRRRIFLSCYTLHKRPWSWIAL